MQLFTLLSSFIIVAGARPVPQSSTIADPAGLPAVNSTTTIGAQDALSILSAGSAVSGSSSTALASASVSAVLTSAASAASAVATDPSNAGNTTLPSSFLNITDPASSALPTDLPSATSLSDDGSDGNSTETSTVDLASASILPTASIDNGTTTATAIASSAATGISYTIPSGIPQACIAKAASGISTSGTITASVVSSTGLSSNDSSSTDPSALTVSNSLSALNASATATVAASSLVSVASGATTSSGISTASSGSSLLATATAAASSAIVTSSAASPLQLVKRIAQDDLPDVAQSWQDLCLVSGGDIFTNEPCVTLAGVNGINALLADADPCDQQDNADAMIDFAKSSGVTNSADLIANAVAYRQHARNAFSINGVVPSTPYCQKAPKNDELKGIVNAQLPGVDPGVYGGPSFGLVAFGDPSSCPFGATPDSDSCGCL